MHWIQIFLLRLTVFQNLMYTNGKLLPEHAPKSSEILSNNLFSKRQYLAYSAQPHNDNDLNGVDVQLMNSDCVEVDDSIENESSDTELLEGSENRDVEKRKCTKVTAKDAEIMKGVKYLHNNAMYTNEQRLVRKHYNTTTNNEPTTIPSYKKPANTLSDKAKMAATKAHAGVMVAESQMRVKNYLHKVDDINEMSRNQMQTTTTQNTKPASSLISNDPFTIASDKVGETPETSALTKPAKTKLYDSNSFLNPFGQLVAFFGSDQLHLQDYTFFFNAERHTVFQLYTSKSNNNNKQKANGNTVPTSLLDDGGRLLNVASMRPLFGVNTPMAASTPDSTINSVAGISYFTPSSDSSPIQVEEVQLYNGKSLRQSRFNPFNPTRILIHGWLGGANADVYQALVPAYLRQGASNYNVFTVDWARGAIADYLTASYRVKPVGKALAKFIDFLQREAGIRYEDLHVIGFSMGAHIAGIAGKHLQTGRLPVIYALDPALPFFRYENFDERIAITDADYIEVIHTSVGSYGYDRPLGHVDFYVNYGSAQPGCFLNECSHWRAYQIFAESLQSKESFWAQGCDVKLWQDMIKHRRCLMGTGRQIQLGGDPLNATALRRRGGVFYLATNAVAPYAIEVR